MEMDHALGFLGILSTVLVALFGWYFVDKLAAKRDVKNERLKLRMEYLIESYRTISEATNRCALSETQRSKLEAAVSDIMVLGSTEQINALVNQLNVIADQRDAIEDGNVVAENAAKETDWGLVLQLLRDELREKLDMPPAEGGLKFLRFPRTEGCP